MLDGMVRDGHFMTSPAAVSSDLSVSSRPEPHLVVQELVTGYPGGPAVLQGVSLSVGRGEIVAVLGRNGAGKTTLLRAISGLLSARAGHITHGAKDVTGRQPHQIAKLGIAHVPEGRRVIPSMTVIDNLRLGGYTTRSRQELERRLGEAFELFPLLHDWRHRVAGTLSGGEQQMLSIARALMGAPTTVLLDEPLTGLAPIARKRVLEALHEIRRSDKAIVLVEQNVVESLPVADHALIMEDGRVTVEGPAEAMRANAAVQENFLGPAGLARPPAAPSFG